MPLPRPRPGLVIAYDYLWRDEALKKREAGRKTRPCVIVLAVERGAAPELHVTVVPMTHAAPREPDIAIEVPARLKEALGLDDGPSWIVLNEVNRFLWPGPDLKPIAAGSPEFSYGIVPRKFMALMVERMRTVAAKSGISVVRRQE